MDYRERHVVVTGGTGALGTAVVGALLEAGAVCHVPYRSEGEAKRFPHGDNKKVSLVALRDLADEVAVTDFYGGLDQLWASIHIAGGFAFAPIATSDKALLLSQLNANLVSAYLCSRAAVALSMSRRGMRWSHGLAQASPPMRSRKPASRHLQWRSGRRSRRTMFW